MNLFSYMKSKPAQAVTALVFCGLLALGNSRPAFASGIVLNDSLAEDFNFIIVIAHYLDELDEWIDRHLNDLKNTLREKLKHEADKALHTGDTNAIIDNARHTAITEHNAALASSATRADTTTGCATIYKNQIANAIHVNNLVILRQKLGAFSIEGISTQYAAYQKAQVPIPLYNLCRLIGKNFSISEIPYDAAQRLKSNLCEHVFNNAVIATDPGPPITSTIPTQ